jgi:DNA-directed RNA polymerase specialized sigma24 family protein
MVASPVFATTHWSVIRGAADPSSPAVHDALEKLCRTYWPPLYAYVCRKGYSSHDAEDLTQSFIARMLEKNYLGQADRQKGKFRSFLLTSLQNFLAHEWERASAKKRGSGKRPVPWDELSARNGYGRAATSDLTPDKAYDQRWAFTLFQQALARLRAEFAAAGKGEQFQQLKGFLSDEADTGAYATVATRLKMTSGAVAVAVHRLRQRYGELVREEIAHTVAHPADVEDEMRYLIKLMSG